MSDPAWRPTLGAIIEDGGTRFRAWAPDAPDIELVLIAGDRREYVALDHEDGYVTAFVPGLRAGARYLYRTNGIDVPDPCSRSQPEGVHAPSEVVDPSFHWTDAGFAPADREDIVLYEAHIGTLTTGGTFESAMAELPRLRELGVTAIELMPVAAFQGQRNWGYDGVALFAPTAAYGGPAGLRQLVNAAHAIGLAVVLDVVYNHFGPSGNYTGLLSRRYLTSRHRTPWGDAVNFDDVDSAEVRRFFVENLRHWIHEYHIDGFRFDATNAIKDESSVHVLAELSATVADLGWNGRSPLLFAETDENDVRYLQNRNEGGHGFDAVWADDFHHVVRTIIHDEHDGYLAAYQGTAPELARTIEQGFLHEGGTDADGSRTRGTEARSQPWRQFIFCVQNHDQVGNRAFGLRLNTTAGSARFLAATSLLLLLPATPLLFQGQEFLASTPFLYFTDHDAELGALVTEGRRTEFAAFPAFGDPATRAAIPDPQAESSFLASKLRGGEAARPPGSLAMALHRELLRLRHDDPVLRASRRQREGLRARAVDRAVVVDIANPSGRAVIAANFGGETELTLDGKYEIAFNSDAGQFGGLGRRVQLRGRTLRVPSETTLFLREPARS